MTGKTLWQWMTALLLLMAAATAPAQTQKAAPAAAAQTPAQTQGATVKKDYVLGAGDVFERVADRAVDALLGLRRLVTV